MSHRITRWLAASALVALALVTAGCRAEGTPEPSPNEHSSTDLVEQPKEFDGEGVTFAGEVIGEAMVRGDMAWLHINDDAYYVKNVEEGAQLGGYNTGIAVWLPAGLAEELEYFGDYEHEGDIVEVAGVFNAACAEHGGDMDIHATELEIVELAGALYLVPVVEGDPLEAVRGLLAGTGYTMDDFYAERRRDKEREEAKYKRWGL